MNLSRSLPLAAAVALALGSAHVSATPLTQAQALTAIGAGQVLVVAGASAQRDAFLQIMQSEVCGLTSGTASLTVFRANPATAQDFRAYACHTVASTGAGSIGAQLGTAADKDFVVFYRSEGGSAWGPYSIAERNIEGAAFTGIKQLDINACVAAAGNANYTLNGVATPINTIECVIGANSYRLSDDSVVDVGSGIGLVDRLTQLGTSDVEPKLFSGGNNPANTSTKFVDSPAIVNALKTISQQTGYGQIFNLIVNNSAAAGNITDEITGLTSSEVTGIFSGVTKDWCKIRPTLGDCATPGTVRTINVVRREPGSGTQVAAGVQFLSQGCGDGYAFVSDGDAPGAADTDNIIEKGTTADLESTVGGTLNAIGVNLFKSTAPGTTKFIQVDNVTPSQANAVNLSYTYAFESFYSKAPTAVLPNGSVALALADGLIALSKAKDRVPVNAAVFAIPSATNVAGTTGALGQPVARGTRGGQSCRPFQPR